MKGKISHKIEYFEPVYRWDEGLPCGNGTLGTLLWGDGVPLNLSLDRSDLWDNRTDPQTQKRDFTWEKLTECLDRNEMSSITNIFEGGMDGTPYPTKLPCGRITFHFPKSKGKLTGSQLDLNRAMTESQVGEANVISYVHAELPLVIVRVRGGVPKVRFTSPFDRLVKSRDKSEAGVDLGDVGRLNYRAPIRKRLEGGIESFRQYGVQDPLFEVAWVCSKVKGEWIFYLTVQGVESEGSWGIASSALLEKAQAMGPVALEKSHLAWWKKYWSKGRIRLPEERFEKLWYLTMYKMGSTARSGTPPISLQGVWTADENTLPPWRGDFHHDLNTQLSYWPVHTANRLEQSQAFSEWLLKWLSSYQRFAQDFYNAPGAAVPCCHSLSGAVIVGWAAYCYSRANGAWLTQHLWLHYRYTMDEEFLKTVAYPFIREVAIFCASQLRKDQEGIYHLDYSSSPEFFGNTRSAYATDSTYDLSLLRFLFDVATRASQILGVDAEKTQQWIEIRAHLQSYPISNQNSQTSPEKGLAIWEGQPLTESHRHFSHLMPIYPLGDLHIEGTDQDRELIQNSLCELECQGTGFWTGYSYSWMACLSARIREPNRVVWALGQYLAAFVSPNSFHFNGDYKRMGASRFHYRPFTLEGNFAAGHAINEMILQSWGGRLRLFPAVPKEWKEVSFTQLRGEGAFVVSAWRKNGDFERAEILSEKGGVLTLENPSMTRAIIMTNTRDQKQKQFSPQSKIEIKTMAGETYFFRSLPD